MAKSSSPSGKIIGISIAALIFATLGWTAIQQLFAANTTGVDAVVITIGTTLVGMIIGIAILVMFLKEAGIDI